VVISSAKEPFVMTKLSENQYHVLLVFRSALRRYLQWSGEQASRLGLTSQQHQLLLAVRAHPGSTPPSIRELSECLLIRHHSTVELVKRVEDAGLVLREEDGSDHRVVRLRLTESGRRAIEELSESHMAELQRVSDGLGITEELLEHLSSEFAQNLIADMHDDDALG
jgi:DNA-binding MarR family transcriptional regulator